MPKLKYKKLTEEEHRKVTRNVPYIKIHSLACDSCVRKIETIVKAKIRNHNLRFCSDNCKKQYQNI